MLLTRKTKIPNLWGFFAPLSIVLTIYGQFVVNAPFLLLIKQYLDNPASIMGLISLQIYLTFVVGPLIAWMSDRIWTKYGRRKFFVGSSDFLKGLFLVMMPFAPNLWVLIILRWLFDFFSDLAAPGAPLVYEIVPAKQRGLSAGFKTAFMQIGNLVFFTLLLGRFHDAYFLGPFQFFATPSGGTIMFLICGLILFGVAVYEFIGIKEIYPPGRKRFNEGRRPGENFFKFFLRNVFGDIFAKDLLPLYLLLLANVMFGFSLGVFQPLLFTEQWGYNLQMFGNTVAIGVPLGILIGLMGGWMADRFGKMQIVFWGTIGSLVINIIYTAYVYTLPDFRPGFWTIVLFGNAAGIFGGIKGVAVFPLLYEYVARNRMGAAAAGIMVFNAIFRNSVGILVGLWLLVWSIWLFPQAGYNVEVTFAEELQESTLVERTQAAGLNMENLYLRPLHQYGVDGETSQRWWIHQQDRQAQKLIKERKNLQNELGTLEGKRIGYFTSEERKAEIAAEMDRKRARIDAIEQELQTKSEALEAQLQKVLEPLRFPPGAQLKAASYQEEAIMFEALTLEPLPEEQIGVVVESLRGQELQKELLIGDDGIPRLVPEVSVTPTQTADGNYAVRYNAQIDPRFVAFFDAFLDAGFTSSRAFDLATGVTAVAEAQFTTRQSDFTVDAVSASRPEDGTSDTPGSDQIEIQFEVRLTSDNGKTIWPDVDEIEELFASASERIIGVDADPAGENYRVAMRLSAPEEGVTASIQPYDEVSERMAELLEVDDTRQQLALEIFRKFSSALAAPPIYVTVPRHTMVANYKDREYEYFFSSQFLQIGTDFLGIAILVFIIILEKRGVLHRYGAEEDQNR